MAHNNKKDEYDAACAARDKSHADKALALAAIPETAAAEFKASMERQEMLAVMGERMLPYLATDAALQTIIKDRCSISPVRRVPRRHDYYYFCFLL